MSAFTSTVAAKARVPAGLLAMQASAPRTAPSSDPQGAVRRSFAKGEQLFVEGDTADFFYKILSGTIRISKLLSDGRRQIDAFHLGGDIFGLENDTEHHFTAEAVEETVVLAFRRSRFTSLLHDNPAFGDQLMKSVIVSLQRAHEHMVLLGRKTALEKMATFLLDMADRLDSGSQVDLPMQRADIADHLGLTIETVSRTLTQLARAGLIKMATCGRTIKIGNIAALEQVNA
jgi:CRP/FNR family nitrogen fixation transcriptional regulator